MKELELAGFQYLGGPVYLYDSLSGLYFTATFTILEFVKCNAKILNFRSTVSSQYVFAGRWWEEDRIEAWFSNGA